MESVDQYRGIGSSAGGEFFVTSTVGIGPSINFSCQSIHEGRCLTVTLLGTWYFQTAATPDPPRRRIRRLPTAPG